MSKSTRLSHMQWAKLHNRLTNDYSPSVMMMKGKMREVLGFLPRRYTYWTTKGSKDRRAYQTSEMHLDWYSESKRTFFLLKYGDYLEKNK